MFISIFEFNRPVITTSDLQLIDKILVTNFHAFGRTDIDFSADANGMTLFQSVNNVEWKAQRKVKSTVFTSKRLKLFYPIVDKCCQQFSRYCEKFANNRQTNGNYFLIEQYSKLALDIFLQCALSHDIDIYCHTNDNVDLMNTIFKVSNQFKWKELFARMPNVVSSTLKLIAFNSDKSMKNFEQIIERLIDLRLKSNVINEDLLAIYLDAINQGNKKIKFIFNYKSGR